MSKGSKHVLIIT